MLALGGALRFFRPILVERIIEAQRIALDQEIGGSRRPKQGLEITDGTKAECGACSGDLAHTVGQGIAARG